MNTPRPPVPGIALPSATSDRTGGASAATGAGTIFESPLFDSFDGWASLLRRAADGAPESGESVPEAAAHAAAFPASEAPPWAPTRRPPIALLHVVDDGRDTGETLRLRGDACVVGRVTGGVTIPHDPHLEEAHARLDRLPGGGWLLTDLGSVDGTWVRVTTARLRPGTVIRIGSTTLLFRADVVALAGPGGGTEVALPAAPFLLGRAGAIDSTALPEGVGLVAVDDPHASPLHAEVIARRGGLRIVNHGLNGLWVRLAAPVRLAATAQFQCGDQRFVLESLAAPGGGEDG